MTTTFNLTSLKGKIIEHSELPANGKIYRTNIIEKEDKSIITRYASKTEDCIRFYELDSNGNYKILPSRVDLVHTLQTKSNNRIFKEHVVEWLITNYYRLFSLFLPWIDSDIVKKEIHISSLPKSSNSKEKENVHLPKKLSYIKTEHKFRSIIGEMQSKKTPVIISHAIYYALVYRIPTIIVIQNSVSAYDQIYTRIQTLIENILKELRNSCKNLPKNLLHPVCAIRGKKANHTLIKKVLNGETCRIFLTLRSETDLEPFNEFLKNKNTDGRLVLMIDESDFTDSGVSSQAQSHLNILKEKASVVYMISATPMTNLIRESIDKEKVIILDKPEYYKGLETVHFKKLEKPASACVNIDDDPFKRDKNLKSYLHDLVHTTPYTISYNNQIHPVISLYKGGNTVQPQNRIAKWLFSRYSNKIAIIVYNSDNISLRGGGTFIPKKSISLSDGTRSNYENGIHYFKNIHVGLLIEYLQQIGAEKIKRIIILTGCMANRGITFGSTNYDECVKNNIVPWHVTEMYFIPSVSMDSGNLLQSAGRICGCYRDDIPLTLYSNVPNDILKAHYVQSEILHRSKQENPEQKLMRDSISTIPIERAKFNRRKMVSNAVHVKFNKVKDDSGVGGWNWRNKIVLKPAKFDEKESGKREEDIKVPINVFDKDVSEKKETKFDRREKERLIEKFEKWSESKSKDDMKIKQFMILITRNPNKIYTKEEIQNMCNTAGIVRPNQLTYYLKQNSSRGYGMILQLLPGDKYRLQPELVNSAIDHFEE